MMNEEEINRILETTKKKIAISQFKKERVESMGYAKENNKFILLRRIGIGTAAGVLLTVGSVGAYVGISGNTEILRNIGINIGDKFDAEKQNIGTSINDNGAEIKLVSAACDSSCIILETEIKLDDEKYKNIDFKIDDLTFKTDSFTGSKKTGLKLSESSASSVMENGIIKLFKYISIKDPNLGADGFLDEVFENSNTAECKIEFSKIFDANSEETISEGSWKLDFTLAGKTKSEFTKLNKEIKVNDVIVNIESINKSTLGNYIVLTANQDNFDLNKENDIQKLEYTIKNSLGEKINIVSKTYNISQEYGDNSKISVEATLKLDDISDDINYDINVQIGSEKNIETKEIAEVLNNNENIETKMQEENKQEELQVSVVEENTNSNSSMFLKNPIDGDLIILRGFNSDKGNGIDILAQEGKSLYSINKGEVVDAGNDEAKGKYITVKYDNNIQVVYSTCSEILKNVGDKVDAGDVIAKTGNTGHSTGPHLHLEIIKDGVQVNPEEYLK